MIANRSYLLIIFLLIVPAAIAQKTKMQLQRAKQENLKKIQETEKILTETTTEKKNSIGELSALNKRIEQQEVLMVSIKAEIELLDYDMEEDNQIISSLESDVEKLKKEYASMIFATQKASGKIDRLTFLFSARSFNQLVMRLKYMEQYGKVRQEQAKAIAKVQQLLAAQVRQTELKRGEKKNLLTEEENENTQLANLKKKQKTLVKTLEREEKRLRKDLADTKKAIIELDNLIAKIIKEELERAATEAKRLRELKIKKNKKANETKEEADAEANVALSASFENNKTKFPWPTDGFVSQKFGRQPHPVLKGIEIQNNGINFQTKLGEMVKTIFNGEVREIAFVQGFGKTIIVSHGEYFSVYSGLREVIVRKGQKVATNEQIGIIGSNSEGVPELRFQIFQNMTPLDPQKWLID